ncbi:MAG: 1-acyl-sn-glycerol-3-phosphate acyltransferase [Desulfobacteraceae bacterium]|nr:1-acyl-sn-glycerol-3-phosphate acyltransferase [Desulfobacteraceae bacterium]
MKSLFSSNKFQVFVHTVVIYIWVIAATIFFGTTAIVFSLFSKTGNSVQYVARTWAWSILWVSGIQVVVNGLENIEKHKSCILMSNHQSNFDIPVLFTRLNLQFRWLAKAELFKIPIFGRGMRGAGYISIDRSNRKSAFMSLKKAAGIIRDGKASVMIFPEGTRSSDGSLLSFKTGGFILAIDAAAPIIPIVIKGTHAIMPKNSLLIRRQIVTVDIKSAIDTKSYTRKGKDDLMAHVRTVMTKELASETKQEPLC